MPPRSPEEKSIKKQSPSAVFGDRRLLFKRRYRVSFFTQR